jgi:hypothetical protein
VHGLAEQPPGGGAGEDHRVRAGLLEQVDVLGLAGGGDDRRVRVQLARGERDEHRRVVAVGGDDHEAASRIAGGLEHRGAARGPVDGGEAERVASSIASASGVDHDDRSRSTPRASSVSTAARPLVPNPMTMVWSFKPLLQIRSRKAVRVRSASTSMVVPMRMIRNRILAGVISSGRDQPRLVGHRRDVAVAGGGDADGRVVQRVEEADGRPVEVAVAVAPE